MKIFIKIYVTAMISACFCSSAVVAAALMSSDITSSVHTSLTEHGYFRLPAFPLLADSCVGTLGHNGCGTVCSNPTKITKTGQ